MNRLFLPRVLPKVRIPTSIHTPLILPLPLPLHRTLATFSTPDHQSISDAIKHDHRELEEYYTKIVEAQDEDTMVRWQNQFVWELARHSLGEELVVYPAFERYLPNGQQMANEDRDAHAEVKVYLKQFQNLTPSDPDFRPTLDSLMNTLRPHITQEETHDLPALERGLLTKGDKSAASSTVTAKMTPSALKTDEKDASKVLAKSFERTKMFVPTRSHPSAPDRPPLFENAVGMLATPIDKLRDMFERFPEEKKG
ncbi:hypothetical protein EX30DRAFT_359870 [Ascodesmis nigricans]|uniref:Hemerythrin-like domain-containing protein n=1 Tax=Ascodesmis nigricans TaxID=341454 RepID=A0A4S2MS20_9PEZI|nr:hypothetical protein EX30DRAFT_359870 [Ascodesmis nigricans]